MVDFRIVRVASTLALALGLALARFGPLAAQGKAKSRSATTASAAKPSTEPLLLIDDAGVTLRLSHPATRIISLLPNATEALVALGAIRTIVGRTRYDVEPELASIPSIGGGLDPSVEAIIALHPDVVIAWEHDRRQRPLEKLAALHIPLLSIRTEDTTDAIRTIQRLGTLTGRTPAANTIVARMRADFRAVARSVVGQPKPITFYVVSTDPPMTASPATFIGQLIEIAGGTSAFPERDTHWPTISMEALVQRQPDVIVLPTGGDGVASLARLRTTAGWRDLAAVREGRVVTVSASLLERPGPNLGNAARAMRDAIQTPAIRQAALARTHR